MPPVPRATLLLLVLLMGAVVGLQAVNDRAALPAPSRPDVLYVNAPEVATRVALSYRSLAADLYWIRALQHYGSTKLDPRPDKHYDLLYPLLDLTTSLDPHFDIAYRFGAIFLAEQPPAGAGRTDLAIALLEKGLRAQPRKWLFAQDIGFVHYWWRHDYPEAARWFRMASQMPDAPEWLVGLAAVVAAEGGDRASSRRLWSELLTAPEADYLRGQAMFRLAQLDALDQIEAIARAVSVYRARTGMPPTSWSAMERAGLLRGVPIDPTGVPYRLDPATGGVGLAPESRLQPLPTGEHARGRR